MALRRKKTKKPINPIAARRISLGLFITAGLLAASSAYFTYRTVHFMNIAESVPGKVIRLEQSRRISGRRRTIYAPVFEFTDKAGLKHTVTWKIKSRPAAWEVGEQAEILYDPADVQGAEPRGFTNWLAPTIPAGFALLLTILGYALRRSARNTRRTPPPIPPPVPPPIPQ